MQSIQKQYVEKVEKLSYKEYLRLILLLYKFHNKLRRCTDAKYYKMMNKKNIKFHNELITKWFKEIKSQLETPLLLTNYE